MEVLNKVIDLLKEYSLIRISLIILISSLIIMYFNNDKTTVIYQYSFVAFAISIAIVDFFIKSLRGKLNKISVKKKRISMILSLNDKEKEYIREFLFYSGIPVSGYEKEYYHLYKTGLICEDIESYQGERIVVTRFNDWFLELMEEQPDLLQRNQ